MQMSTGAVNVKGTDFENGHGTVVNGLREDFNGFLINGVSNKGLSGGAVNTPIQDSVEEFQQLELNMSAQYGNSAGGTVNLVTKAGTNVWHGSAWEYLRNDALDSNWFFNNQGGVARQPLRFNQFGVTVGGPIIKDKLFFFLSLQGDRFKTSRFRQPICRSRPPGAMRSSRPSCRQPQNTGLNSTAALLYKDFATSNPGTPTDLTADSYTGGNYGYDPALALVPGSRLRRTDCKRLWWTYYAATPEARLHFRCHGPRPSRHGDGWLQQYPRPDHGDSRSHRIHPGECDQHIQAADRLLGKLVQW